MFDIILKKSAEKSLKDLDKGIVKKINRALLDFKDYHLHVKEYNLKKVSGRRNTYRLRISRYRIIYSINWKKSEINVLKIEKKDDETYRL